MNPGRVIYYQKPANAVAATGGPMGDVVPASDGPVLGPALPPLPDTTPLTSVQPPNGDPSTQPVPDGLPKTSQKQPKVIVSDNPTQPLPDRKYIFEMYDDQRLERAVVESIQKQNPGVDLSMLQFPGLRPVVPPGTPYVTKTAGYAPRQAVFEPNYVVHRRLHFEEKNAERYGWDLGFIQPLVSTAYFYKDVILWPNSLASGLEVGFWDTSAGKCLPGSPIPYYLYPPGLTITGMLFEGGIITGTGFILRPVGAAAPFVAP